MTKVKILSGRRAGKIIHVEPRDLPREMLGWIVAAFVDEESLQKSERYFYVDEVDARMPEGKAVKVTFEYVDLSTCGTCGAELPE